MNSHNEIMKKCLSLAKKAKLNTYLNPLVGAILVDSNGNILSTGYHKKYGEAHAEVNCIKNYKGNFENTILYVNLEPCSHFGKTPPCADLIIEKGIKKVIIAIKDPNPKVAGAGIERLRNAGVEVVVGILENEAKDLNKVFLKNIEERKPYISTKIATTLDGKIATINKSSKWITGEKSRKFVRKIRDSHYAIMSASGTILADNSSLKGDKRKIARIILDKNGEIPLDFKVFEKDGARIIYSTNSERKLPDYIEKIPFENYDKLMKTLYSMGIPSILVEAGCGLNSELLKAKEIDYVYQFIAPKIIGDGISYADKIQKNDINLAIKIKNEKTTKIDDDILVQGKILY